MKPHIAKSVKAAMITAAIFSSCAFAFASRHELIPSKVLKKISIPKWYHEGLYFDGNNIWVNNGEKGKTWVIDPSNGKLINEITPAGAFTEAVTSGEEGKYFVTDWDGKKIYAARIENNAMIKESEASLEPAHPAGAVWNGKNIFVVTWLRGLTGTKFHILKMDEKFNLLERAAIQDIQEPAHLAWDGKNLWAGSWYDRRVYKLDAETFKVLGYFRSPAKKTTGIAWDGKSFWVTGTYADLYKVEIKN